MCFFVAIKFFKSFSVYKALLNKVICLKKGIRVTVWLQLYYFMKYSRTPIHRFNIRIRIAITIW